MRPKKEKVTSDRKKEISEIKEIRETLITFQCPVRGLVTEKVKVKVFPKVQAYDTNPQDDLAEFLRQEGIINEDE